MSETPRPDPWAQVSEYLIGSGRYHRVDQVDAARAADAAERDRAIAEVCAFSREQGIEAARAELEANALIAQLQAERDTLRAELDAARTTVQNLTRERDDAYVKLAEYVFPPGLADEQLAHEATKQQHAERTVERDAAQQQIATLTQELSVSRANHIDANQRNMQSVRELEAAEARCAALTEAIEKALGFHQVTHTHAILSAALQSTRPQATETKPGIFVAAESTSVFKSTRTQEQP